MLRPPFEVSAWGMSKVEQPIQHQTSYLPSTLELEKAGNKSAIRIGTESLLFLSMKTRLLGNSDLEITAIGFGAWALGGGDWEFGWGEQDDAHSIAAIHRALELGINWIDTAAVYGLGHSEEVVARALREWKGKRPYVFTKCGMIWNQQRKIDYSLRADSVRRECEASLSRLKTDVIDLYQIHWAADDLSETIEGWNALAALQKEGKVRWIGLSNATARCVGRSEASESRNSSEETSPTVALSGVPSGPEWEGRREKCARNSS